MTTTPAEPSPTGDGLQPGVDSEELWLQPQMLTVSVPLLDRARELINRDVLVIAGGSRLDGRLVAVDDEQLLLTVEDAHWRFFIDLQSVAVLAVGRG